MEKTIFSETQSSELVLPDMLKAAKFDII